MKGEFYDLVDRLCRALPADEVLLCQLSAERSDFIRFNRALVRQAGSVSQRYLSLRLIRAGRQAAARVSLAGSADDVELCWETIGKLRETLTQLPQDPWLLYSEDPHSTSLERRGRLAPPEEIVGHVTSIGKRVDFVGFYAAGTMYRGFANSLGQRNWHAIDTYNFDWSLHLQGDKAVKDGYAGFDWDAGLFEARLEASARRLELMRQPSRTLAPGEYRVYLTPRALEEITGLLQWDAFSARARATRRSPWLRMEPPVPGERSSTGDLSGAGGLAEKAPRPRLSAKVTMLENTEAGLSPCFQEDGFIRPPVVTLIAAGELGESLVSPRSAREYGLRTNGASSRESPEALEMKAGSLEEEHVLEALDTGLHVGNLWYLNFSDKPAGRMTGMTRFATFWVEKGQIVAPVTPLRFDDTLYNILGTHLVDLTRSRDLLLSTSTYDERSTASSHLPGALLERLCFTL